MSSCANPVNAHGVSCAAEGKLACKNCRLVLYCTATCQKLHWPKHKLDCKSDLMKDSWKPAWAIERRPPSFVGGGTNHAIYGTPKFLWGNSPAIDIVKLPDNETVAFPGPLNLLFAASGDLRNVLKSVVDMPAEYHGDVNIFINDHDTIVAARNVIILLILLTVDDPTDAADHAMHVFYSAFLTEACYETLQTKVKPFILEVWSKIQAKPLNTVLAKTWDLQGRQLRVVFTKGAWHELLLLLDVPAGVTKATAQAARSAIVRAPERVDYVDRHLLKQIPAQRVSIVKFRQDGLLLPFGASRTEFKVPNPTFFHKVGEWPMMDDADPRAGWCYKEVQAGYRGLAINDIYGMLHQHLTRTIVEFHRKLRAVTTSFVFTNVDATKLGPHLGDMRFARIETSNIADKFYLGLPQTAASFGPFLQPPAENPHATLIMSFMNATKETYHMLGMDEDRANIVKNMQRVATYMKKPSSGTSTNLTGDVIAMISAQELVWDFAECFDLFLSQFDMDKLAAEAGVEIKEKNTIIEPWPMRFKFGPPTAEKKKEFAELLASHHTGLERYVEWQVKRDAVAENVD